MHVGAALLDALDVRDGCVVEMLAPDEAEERRRLAEVREHRARRDALAVAELDPDRPSVLDHHAPDRRLEAHLAALLGDRLRERFRERAHAALHAPHESPALVLREGVDEAERASWVER